MRRFFLFLLTCIAIVMVALGGVGFYVYHYYNMPGPLSQESTVVFKRGEGFIAIVDDLEAQGVIRNPVLFKAIAVLLGDARKFKAGEYKFSAAISPRLIMDMIAEGRVVVHKLTVAEGLAAREVIMLLNNEPALEGAITTPIAEGSLLPETYHFTYGETRQALIGRMQAGMVSVISELWEKRAPGLPFATPAEAVTLASIVEKETGVTAERPRVASVFINRLRKGMKLQTDPTVVYGIEAASGAPMGRNLLLSDLRAPTAYNTYVIEGLPPGPIANPGRASIEAVLHPADTNDLFFVATGTGGHNFSATLAEHNRNVAAYRAKMATPASQP